MRYLLFLLLFPVMLSAQVPSITTNSLIRFEESNNVFVRPVSDLRTTILPSGVTNYTMRYNGSNWVGSSILRNDGSNLGINVAPSSSYLLYLKQNGTSDGIAIERSSSGKLLLSHGSAGVISTDTWNMELRSAGQLSIFGPGGGGQTNQVFVSAQTNITTAAGNAGLLRFGSTYAPTTSGGDFAFLKFLPTVNQTGSANQDIFFMDFNPTLTATTANVYGIRYQTSAHTFLYQPNGTSVKNHLIGNLGIGTGTSSPAAKLHIVGNGSTSGTLAATVRNSSDSVTIAFRDDRRVGIGKETPAEALDVNGQARVDALDIRNWSGSANTTAGQVQYHDGSGGTYSAYLTYGAGERRFPVLPYTIQLQAIDYNTDWTTGRTKAFWTVPARFSGWKVSKVYLMVSTIGSTTGNTIEVEKGGTALATQTITTSDHTVVLDTALSTGDIFTFDITSVGATASKGLYVEIELRHN